MEVAMTLTPELKQAVEEAGDEPVRMEDPETHAAYVVIREELYRKLREEAVPESDFTLHEYQELTSLAGREPHRGLSRRLEAYRR
jgi:hypothetical protein